MLCIFMITMAAKKASAKSKQFKWTSEMIGDLSTCLKAFKTKIEFQGVDFGGDRTAHTEKLQHLEVEVIGQRSHLTAQQQVTTINRIKSLFAIFVLIVIFCFWRQIKLLEIATSFRRI